MDRRVVGVLANRLRAHERRELELLHVGLLLRRSVRDDLAALAALARSLHRSSALLRELEVVEGELVERRHVGVVDGERALEVQLRAVHVVLAALPALRAVTRHLHHGEVDERGDVLELRVGDGLLEGADGGVLVSVSLVLVERDLRACVVELRVDLESRLELRPGVLVVVAALVSEPRVERRLRVLSDCLELLGDVGASLVVPVVLLVVLDEEVDPGVELRLIVLAQLGSPRAAAR